MSPPSSRACRSIVTASRPARCPGGWCAVARARQLDAPRDDPSGGELMRRPGEMMKLGSFYHPTGHHVAAWMHPRAQIDAGMNFKHYVALTQASEQAKFDLV